CRPLLLKGWRPNAPTEWSKKAGPLQASSYKVNAVKLCVGAGSPAKRPASLAPPSTALSLASQLLRGRGLLADNQTKKNNKVNLYYF
ncbi:hypothetical protein NJH78_30900, partial [Pseudomonas chlororaphis]|uniref:hypothetical protein n=1 Tax=Pseudomonas chlororaphis TaxID=587753 RepID=UPI00209B68D9